MVMAEILWMIAKHVEVKAQLCCHLILLNARGATALVDNLHRLAIFVEVVDGARCLKM